MRKPSFVEVAVALNSIVTVIVAVWVFQLRSRVTAPIANGDVTAPHVAPAGQTPPVATANTPALGAIAPQAPNPPPAVPTVNYPPPVPVAAPPPPTVAATAPQAVASPRAHASRVKKKRHH